MAKKIKLSDDAGSTYSELPGSTGEFSVESEQIEDTVFGQTFQSNTPGLISWGVTANGIFKGFAGYLAEIKKQGTPTAFTAEACALESGQIYKISDATKEIWDRSQTLTFYDTAVDKTAFVEWVDYLFGRVKFLDSYTVTGAVTATGKYLPTAAIAKGNSYTLTMSADTNDTSDFDTCQGNGGYKTFAPGLRTVQLEMGGVFDATEALAADLAARSELIIEVDPAGDGSS